MKLPVFFHPTTTVLVDDSDSFLRSLAFQLDPLQVSISFHDPAAALNWIERSARSSSLPLQVDFDNPNQPAEQRNVKVDVENVHRISTQGQRFAIPSVLVVDYSMPQMDGLSFCEAIRHLPCKKILFTGAADEKIAVQAFNRGLIDRYIKKSADDALDRLEREIAELQQAYFLDQSKTLRDMLVLHDFSFLQCAALTRVVRQLYIQYDFVEHYIFPNPSGILFLTRDGQARLMIVETERGLQAQYEVARDSNAPASLLTALQERRVLPFFPHLGGDGMYSDDIGQHWHRYCRVPEVCHGRESYFWALFELPPELPLTAVVPYRDFLRQQRPPLAA
jgi:CheY-like chemotaxis protein